MNKNNAKDYLPLVQALAEGKTIQVEESGRWIDMFDVAWVELPERYRIKPEPREIIVWYNDGFVASVGDVGAIGWKPVKFREVIE